MQEQQPHSGKSELLNLSLRDLFYKYVRFLPLFVLSVALTLFAAFIYLRYTVPIYRVGSSMIIKSEQPGSARSNDFEDVFINDRNQNIQSEIEILKSKPLMQRVVDSLHLQFSYYAKGKIKTVNVYKQTPFLLNAYKIADSNRTFTIKVKFITDQEFRINNEKKVFTYGQTFQNNDGVFSLTRNPYFSASKEYSIIWSPTPVAARAYAGALAISPRTPGTGILGITMITANPQLGADILNKLMEEYSSYTILKKQQSSDQVLAFINEAIANTGRQLDSVNQALLRYKLAHDISDVEKQSENYINNLSEADKEIIQQTLEKGKAQDVEDYLKDKRNEFAKVPSTLMLQDVTFSALVAEYNKAQLERQGLLESQIPETNPAVVEKTAEIERLRISILENLRNIKASISSTIAAIQRRSQLNQSDLRQMPVVSKELEEIERSKLTLEGRYKNLLEQRLTTEIRRVSTISNSDIIDRSYPSSVPVKPNKKAIRILAVLLGLGLPALFIFVAEILNDKVSTRFDIEKITTAPILGEIGHSYSNNVLIVNKTTRSMVAEQFRIIRSNLQYILNKSEKSIILVTSSYSGEGKSYVSINMGAVLALAGKKTIILEFDIRKPKVLAGMGLPKGQGITNYLVGKGKLEDLVKPVPDQDNLFVLGCGPIPPNPAELLLDPKVEQMFEWLRNHYDVVLVDTAPVGMVSDAMTLSKFADCTLYLVRQGHTFKKQIALIDEFYQANKLPKLSIIVNDVKLKPGYGYYGYGRYGYGYGYGYGSYYEEETPPQNFFEKLFSKLDIRRIFTKKKRK
ncbi:MAG: polysaccharide biosynthesis tyrosine autokinase [Chitinophagaceae bacterium]|nr:polysaccharide biosynthesis tyrosine autokinase [Chitinophagaceae bacterium]